MVISLIKKNKNNWITYIICFTIFIAIIWLSHKIVYKLKIEEHKRVENYARSLELLSSSETLDLHTQDFLFKLIKDNNSIPVALVDEKGNILDTKNIDKKIQNDSVLLKRYINELKKSEQSIEIKLTNGKNYVYFSNSKLLNQLKYYPSVISFFILCFFGFTYWYLKTVKDTEKSYLWAGMAKETAHQIGTPLSSLMGWVELLKYGDISQSNIHEMENDINRLRDIADRFSKIGSKPELSKNDIIFVTKQTVNYISNRISKGIKVNFHADNEQFIININTSLYSWVIENLMKNAADAMRNKGVLDVFISTKDSRYLEITISDTGSGIPSKLRKRIFEPGFSTKKRGWGLGLSLAKRIINDYHKGNIFVNKSYKDNGTEFKILLKK